MKKWCGHTSFKDGCLEIEYTYPRMGRCVWLIPSSESDVNFCPICGTPRPKELTLAEKFRDCGSRRQTNTISDATDFYQELAQIAHDHYTERERG